MEIMPTVQGIDYLRRNLRRWMRPRARRVAMHFRPGTAKVVLQPLGIVGVISPWNYPASLCLTPLATAIAAGDRAMVKPSEHTPKTSELIVALVRELFAEEQVAVVTGGSDVGEAFAALPFDHLVFTGQHERRARRHAGGQREPGVRDARARRQVAGDHRPGLLADARRQVDRLRKVEQRRPDLHRA